MLSFPLSQERRLREGRRPSRSRKGSRREARELRLRRRRGNHRSTAQRWRRVAHCTRRWRTTRGGWKESLQAPGGRSMRRRVSRRRTSLKTRGNPMLVSGASGQERKERMRGSAHNTVLSLSTDSNSAEWSERPATPGRSIAGKLSAEKAKDDLPKVN